MMNLAQITEDGYYWVRFALHPERWAIVERYTSRAIAPRAKPRQQSSVFWVSTERKAALREPAFIEAILEIDPNPIRRTA